MGHATTEAVTNPSLKKPGFETRAIHVQFVVDEVALEQAFLWVLWFSLVTIIPHIH
jgi:hypothetical protein